MSATRSSKVSERVAPKAADPQPPKKKHDDDDGPTFAMLFHAWVEAHRASLLDSLKRLGKQPIGSFFYLPGDGGCLESADGPVVVA